jgi:hypothetical protein
MKWRDCLPRPRLTERLDITRQQLAQLREENKRFPVDRLVEIPRADWPCSQNNLIRVLRNRDFLVQVFEEGCPPTASLLEAESAVGGAKERGRVLRLSVQRCAFDRASGRWIDGITWDDLQHLKTLAGYGDSCGIELFPPDSHVVNVANLRHIWIVPDAPAFMWRRS